MKIHSFISDRVMYSYRNRSRRSPAFSKSRASDTVTHCFATPYAWIGSGQNKSMIGLPVVREREMPLASWGLLIGMSSAW